MVRFALLLACLTAVASRAPVKLWTRRELAGLLQVNITTVDRWISAGELDSVLIGRTRRIPDTALQDWMHRRMRPATDNARSRKRKAS